MRLNLLPLGLLVLFTGCANTYPCGEVECGDDQYCDSGCGPTGGSVTSCEDLPSGCADCSCLVLTATQSCTMIDGHPIVTTAGCI